MIKPTFKDEMAISTIHASVIRNAWILAMDYSIFNYVMAASLARNNVDAFVAVAGALAASDNSAEIRSNCAGSRMLRP